MVRQAPPESVYSVMSDPVSGWLMRIEVRPEDLHALPAVRAVGDDDAPAGLEIERARFEQASFLEPDLDDLAERLGLRVDSIHRVGAAVEHERGAVGSLLERQRLAEDARDVRGQAPLDSSTSTRIASSGARVSAATARVAARGLGETMCGALRARRTARRRAG
jgi:hypothetical protein